MLNQIDQLNELCNIGSGKNFSSGVIIGVDHTGLDVQSIWFPV